MGEMVAAAVVVKQTQQVQHAAATAGLANELVAWCRSHLAHYKVPSQVRKQWESSAGVCVYVWVKAHNGTV